VNVVLLCLRSITYLIEFSTYLLCYVKTLAGNHTWLVISTVLSILKHFSRLQAVMCAVNMVISPKCCKIENCYYRSKGFLYSLPSVEPRANPGVQAVSPQLTISHPPGGRLPLLSARPAVTFPVAEDHRFLAGTKLYCLVTEAYFCVKTVR